MAERYANCTVSYEMHSDRRFDLLAELGGWTRNDACWRMVQLWARCTAMQTDCPPSDEIRIHLGKRGEELLVDSALGQRRSDGVVRVLGGGLTGGDTDRFSWYAPVARRGAAGGLARKNSALRDQTGKFVPATANTVRSSKQSSDSPATVQQVASEASKQPASYPQAPASGFRIPDQRSESLPPARAIPPTVAPAPEPEMDEIVQPPPELVHPPTIATPDEIALEARRRVQLELRAELERERRAVAADLGVTDHGLLAQDPGERDLAMHLVAAGPLGLAAARAQALHAIAMAGLEARAEPRKFQWLTGAIFSDRNFRRLVGTTAAEASRPPPPTRAARELAQRFGGEASAPARPRRKDPPPAIAKGADPAELLELAAAARASLYGSTDLARAPPAGAPPTESPDDEQPEPAEAT